jgi:lysophospholipase L1-like esterase
MAAIYPAMLLPRSLAASLIFIIAAAAGAQAQTVPAVFPLAPIGQGENGDWAYFAKYRAANAQLAPDANRIVFIGDSITEIWAIQPGFTQRADFVGRGASAQTTLQMLVRFTADALRLKPRVIHLMGGTNDVAGNAGPETDEQIQDAISAMVTLAKADHVPVVLGSIPPASEMFWHRGLVPAPRIQRLNAWLKAYAAAQHLVYADYWTVLSGPDGGMKAEFSADGVHPNAAGFAVMMPVLDKALAEAARN